MGVNHPGLQLSMEELIRIVRREAVATIQNASIGRAGLRVYDGGSITIQGGGLFVTGTESVSGLLSVSGRLLGSGELVWSGPWELSGAGDITGPVDIDGNTTINGTSKFVGPMTVNGTSKFVGNMTVDGQSKFDGAWDFAGNGKIQGNVDITGALDVKNRLTVGATGYIDVGPIRLDRAHASGGRIVSTVSYLNLDAVTAVVSLAPGFIAENGYFDRVRVNGPLEVTGSKQFVIDHPSRQDHVLRHAATESPVSGVEYAGTIQLDSDGEAVVELPDYFEALTNEDGRTAHLTAIGRPFPVGYDPIADGRMTVYGDPGRELSWLVKAARRDEHGGHFTVEEQVIGPLRKEDS